MILSTRLIAAGAGLVAIALAAVPALAQDAAAVLTQRQDAMKAQGRSLTAIRNFVEDKGDLVTAQAAGAQLVQSLQAVPNLFPQKTSLAELPGKTRAKPEIWQQWDKFVAADQAAVAQAQALNAALQGGDKAAITAALGNLARDVPGTTPTPGGCGACHAPFRGPQT
jgi:cytochrome c556